MKVLPYSTQVAGARRGVQAEEKPCNRNHVVFDKRLWEETLKRALAVVVKKDMDRRNLKVPYSLY